MRWAFFLVAGCAYHPGSYADYRGEWPGTRVDAGCVEMAVARENPSVIDYSFGNRCGYRAMLDLASVRVIARASDGREVPLHAYDPRHEIHAAWLPALLLGRESIEYQPAVEGAQLCVDVGSVNVQEPRRERWVCL